jgi:ribonuclease BN (tRNA processing enzyme)
VRLTMLGTQGWIPTQRRETTSLAIADGERLLIFDAGTGLGRLVEPPASALLQQAREFHLFLTHYHLDHVCGLAYLPGLFAGRALHIHAPEASINGVDIEKGIGELIRHPYNPGALELAGLTLDSLKEGANDVAGHEVRVRRQCHPDTTVAYRVDDAFVIATDTVSDPETAQFTSPGSTVSRRANRTRRSSSRAPTRHTRRRGRRPGSPLRRRSTSSS